MSFRTFLKGVVPAMCLTLAASSASLRAAPPESVHPPEPETKPVATGTGGIDARDAGTVTGVVRFKGTKPEAKPISDIAGNAFCKNCYKDELPKKDVFVFGRNGDDDTLQNVLVYVSKGLQGKEFEPPKQPVVLDQVGCVYVPHVVAVMAGQPLEVRNSDATLHNVMCTPRQNPPFNFGMPGKDQAVTKVFKEPEFRMNFHCFMHPWMNAYVHVLDNPFFAVTGPDGAFTIKGLPPGEYELTVLHESSLLDPEPATATAKVGANETKKVDFVYGAKGEKK